MSPKALNDLRALSQAVDKEEYLQQASKWQHKLWVRSSPLVYKGKGNRGIERGERLERFSKFSAFIDEQPNPISRGDVFAHIRGVKGDPKGLEQSFVLAMLWGFGLNTLGPYRTSVMLESAGPDFGNQLLRIVDLLNKKASSDEDVHAAYDYLLNLEMCGPAFATKFMYFASPEKARIPIFDSQVADWLGEQGRTGATNQQGRLSALNRHHFFAYFEFCKSASEKLEITDIGLLEYLMFIDQQRARLCRAMDSLPRWIRQERFPENPSNP